MDKNIINILAVADPAVQGYIDKKYKILEEYPIKTCIKVVPWSEYYSQMLSTFEGKGCYDIVMVAGHLWKKDFINNDYISPIDFSKTDILPKIAEEMFYKGEAYLSPSFCDGHMVVYRKSMMKKIYGQELPPIITPEKYIEIARKFYDNGHKIAMKADVSEIFTDALPFLRMYGGDIYDEDSQKICCDRSEIVRGLERYCELKKYSYENTDKFGNEEVANCLKQKKVAMGITWSGQLGVISEDDCIERDDLGFSTLSTAWNVTWSFAINKKSEKKETANKILEFLRSERVDEVAGQFSGAPIRTSTYIKGLQKYPWYSAQIKMVNIARPLPDLDSAGEKNSVLYKQIQHAFSGKKTAEKAMREAQVEIEKIK